MSNIKRRVSFIKGLQDELDDRVHRVADLVTDISTINGTSAFDDKYVSANALKTSVDSKIDKTSIVNDLTTGGVTSVLSSEQGKQLKILLDGMATGLIFKGSFDIGVETTLPASPITGDFYKVVNSIDASASVTIGGIHLTQGDSLYYGTTEWIKLDSTESADLLRDGDVSTNSDFTVDGTKLTDRTSIKTLVDASVALVSVKFINESVTITADGGTLAHAPVNNVIFTGVASINNGDGTFDLVECTASGTTLTLSPDAAGTYNGLQAKVTYAYI